MQPIKVFTFISTMTLLHCDAEQLPAPTNLSHIWLNAFTVNISWVWTRPSSLDECTIIYTLDPGLPTAVRKTKLTHLITSDLAERSKSSNWKYSIVTSVDKPCSNWRNSTVVYGNIHHTKPRVDVAKDFKCLIKGKGMLLLMNCSWTPVDSSRNLKLSYKDCGSTMAPSPCERPYRNGCRLELSGDRIDICMATESERGWNVFKPALVVPPPTLNITEDGHHLQLTWTTPDLAGCSKYEFCYTQCERHRQCQNTSGETRIPYDNKCHYEFKSRTINKEPCPEFGSDWSEHVSHGSNKLHDATLTVAMIVVPIALFACIILTCYCLRTHRDILCPKTHIPSAILKDVLNGNKEHKIERLYTPRQESVDTCKIILSSESDPLQDKRWKAKTGDPL